MRLKQYACVKMVELPPFHTLGEEKWRWIGRAHALADVSLTMADEVE